MTADETLDRAWPRATRILPGCRFRLQMLGRIPDVGEDSLLPIKKNQVSQPLHGVQFLLDLILTHSLRDRRAKLSMKLLHIHPDSSVIVAFHHQIEPRV